LLVRANLVASVETLDRDLAGVRDELTVKDAALVEVSARAEVLGVELAGVREQVSIDLVVRENLSSAVRSLERELKHIENELVAKDAVLVEVSAKADYLFTELAGVRDELVTKEASQVETTEKLQNLQNKFDNLVLVIRAKTQLIEKMDQELLRVSVQAIQLNNALTQNEVLLNQNSVLLDGLTWSVKDLHTLTSRRSYRASRKVRLFLKTLTKLKMNGISVQRDVLPIHSDPDQYVKFLIESGFISSEYFDVNQDVEESQINPYSHYQHIGLKENRKIR
jgi:chromosome segregation ATPase